MLVNSHYADFSKYYGMRFCCEWRLLECGVVNILTIDDGLKESRVYPEIWAYEVCCFDLQPHNLNLPLSEGGLCNLHSVTKVKTE